MTTEPTKQPIGKSIAELKAIVAANNGRWSQMAEVWEDLLESEQVELIKVARGMAASSPVYDKDSTRGFRE